VIALGLMLSMTTWFSTAAVLGELRERWDLSTNESSVLIVVLQVGFVVGAVVSAALGLADRVGARQLIAASAALAAVANGLIVVIDGYGAAVGLRFLTGAFLAGVYPPALKLVATWFRVRRGAAMGVMIAALTVGSAAPHLANAVGGIDGDLVMVITSLTTLTGAAVVIGVARDGPFPFVRSTFVPSQAWRAIARRDVRLPSMAYFGHMWELYAMWAWIGVFLEDAIGDAGAGLNPSAWAFIVIAIGAPGSIAAGLLGDRVGKDRAAIAAMIGSGSMALVVALPGIPIGLVLVLALVWGATVVADSAQFSAIVSERAEPRYVGTALTAQLAFGFLLTTATIWLVPLLRDNAGWWGAFAVLAPGPLLGALALRRLPPPPSA
jgi:MFS family permease